MGLNRVCLLYVVLANIGIECNEEMEFKTAFARLRRSVPPTANVYTPTYPFQLSNVGIDNPVYHVSVARVIDSFDIKGCFNYVVVQGRGIVDHFQVPCSKEGTSIASKDVMTFGRPTSTLGLFSDTPSTLVILNKGVCFVKRYNPTPTTPAYMDRSECEQIKKKMAKIVQIKPGGSNSGDFNFSGFEHAGEKVEYSSGFTLNPFKLVYRFYKRIFNLIFPH